MVITDDVTDTSIKEQLGLALRPLITWFMKTL